MRAGDTPLRGDTPIVPSTLKWCGDGDSSSACLASSVNSLQLQALKNKGVRIYTKEPRSALRIVADVPATTAYLYIPPDGSSQLSASDLRLLRTHRVDTLHIYRQVPRKLFSEHLETIQIPTESTPTSYWVWFVVLLLAIVVAITAMWSYYHRRQTLPAAVTPPTLPSITLVI